MRETAAPASVMPAQAVLPLTLLQSIAVRFGAVALNAATGIVTARALHPEGRGELAALVLWPVVFAGLTTFGLPSALVYHLRRTPQRASALVGTSLLLAVLTGTLGTLLGWVLVPLWLGDHGPAVIAAARYCLFGTVVTSLSLVGRAAWEASGRFHLSNFSQLLAPATILGALVVQVRIGTLSPRAAAWTYVLAGLPVLAWILVSLIRTSHPTLDGVRGSARELLHYGSRSYGVDLCGMLALYVDQALVVGLLNPAAMGLYVVALSLARVLNAVHTSVAMMVFPRTVGLEPAVLRAAISRAARLGSIVTIMLGIPLVLIGPVLVIKVYGAPFAFAGQLLPILVAEVVLAGIVHVLLMGLMSAGRPGVATLVQVSGLTSAVPIFLWLVPAHGARGAAVALTAATAIRLCMTLAAYRCFVKVPVPRIWIGLADLAEVAAYRKGLITLLSRHRATASPRVAGAEGAVK